MKEYKKKLKTSFYNIKLLINAAVLIIIKTKPTINK